MTQSRTSLRIASLPVKMARNFLLKTFLRVSVNNISSVSSIMLPVGVSVFEVVFIPGVDGVVSENVTLVFVGVDLDRVALALDIVLIELTELSKIENLFCLFIVKLFVG